MSLPNRLFLSLILLFALSWGRCALGQDAASPIAPVQDGALGSIQGTVTDPVGDAVIDAQVTLSGDALPEQRQFTTDDEGCFHFARVPAGSFTIKVISQGFADGQLAVTLNAGQQLETPDIALAVASVRVDAQVTFTVHQQAEEEMLDEETQRVAGVIPNFYVTYNWKAAPMSPGEKYRLAWRNLYDPVNLAVVAGIAGIEQATNTLPGYGPGPAGYGKRLGANAADFAIGSMLGGAVLPQVFHQDPRYIYKGTGTVASRALYAVAAAFICKGDNGTWQPNYSSVLADVATGAAANLYYPSTNRDSVALTIENGLIGSVDDAIGNLVQEFVIRHLTRHPPAYAAAAPAAFKDVFKPFSWK